MGSDSPAVRRISRCSNDLGEVEAFWRDDLHANVVFDDDTRLGTEAFTFRSADRGGLTAGLLCPNVGCTVQGGPSDTYVASLDASGGTTHVQAGTSYPSGPQQTSTYRPGLGPRVTWVSPHSAVTFLRMERWVLERHLEHLLGRPVTGPIALAPRFRVPAGPTSTWPRLLRLFTELMLDGDNPVSRPAVLEPLREAVLSSLLLSVDHQYRQALAEPAQPCLPRYVRHAVDAIHAYPELPYTVAGLAELCGVSARALQQGFRTGLGTSPMAYLRNVRLAHAHDELMSGQAGGIADVAYRWGFAHLGRFAAAYAERYGEVPSRARRHKPTSVRRSA